MNTKRLFSITEPCINCPFRKDNDLNLNTGRLEGIIEDLHNNIPFHCHKTIDYTQESKEQQIEDALYCGGSMVYLKKCGNTNVPMRLGQMYGLLKLEELRGEDLVIEPMGLDKYIPPSTTNHTEHSD
ncbi:hypothetical protein [Paenibacillus terrae]|uniref:hypothetical protein n=1 Tax=Paenibacillus terrae TaxID=159743 RepID=UPI000697F326|nr:hypothetical protein [Paenibacillus terrae]